MSSCAQQVQPPRLLLTAEERQKIEQKIFTFNKLIQQEQAANPKIQGELLAFKESIMFLKGNFQTSYDSELRIHINTLYQFIQKLEVFIVKTAFFGQCAEQVELYNKQVVTFKVPLPVPPKKLFNNNEKQMVRGKLTGIRNLLSHRRGKDEKIKKYLLAYEETLNFLSEILHNDFDKEERDGVHTIFEFLKTVEPIFVKFVVIGEECDLAILEQVFADKQIGPVRFVNF